MFLEILLVLYTSMAMRVGNVGAVIVLLVSIIPIVLATFWLVNWSVNSFVGLGSNSLSAPPKVSTKREKKIAVMDADALLKWIAKHPRDLEARESLCGKYKEKGDLEAYAREYERLLSLHAKLDTEERSMRHHKLADLYLGPLGRPEKARQILRDFVDAYSDTPQAKLMRQRLERM